MENFDDCRHVVALSGGKDSTAMALRLAEVEPRDYEFICTPTGAELPEMERHWQKLEKILGKPIQRLGHTNLQALVRKEKMLPNWRARFCTHILKIMPFEKHLAMSDRKVVAYVGLRADEENREGATYGTELIVNTRFPMREWGWGINDVLSYLEKNGIKVPERTDCDRCPLQTLGEWYKLWKNYPDRFEQACQDEDLIGHTYRSPQRDTWPASLRLMAKRFEAGEVPQGRKRKNGGCKICSM
jgi:3'-phosphoadenosine 5'-phosphosulfate sulfotransferase (PAPS reductase)/FAD synthetase